jgi:acyl-CoA thioesterase I
MRVYVCLAALLAVAACSGPKPSPAESKETPTPGVSPRPPGDRPVLVVFGDSLSAGYGLEVGQSFPDVMQKKLTAAGYSWEVVNLGISGDTTEGGLERVDSALSLKPKVVILELGGNDGLRGLPITATRENLNQMIQQFQKGKAKVVLAGMTLPPNYGRDYIRSFEKMYKDLATQYKVTLIPFLLSDIVTKDMRYIQPDGIHPTAEGAQIVAGTVIRDIQPLLGTPVR